MFHIKKDAEFRTKNNSPLFPTSEKIKNQLTYDITHWIDKFHLQQCVFIEIGEGFCAVNIIFILSYIFVDFHPMCITVS